MKIKTKLLLGLSTLPFVIIFVVGTGWYQISNINKTSSVLQKSTEMVLRAQKIQREVKNEAIQLRDLILLDDKNAFPQEISALQTESELVNQDINSLEGIVSSDEQKRLVNDLKNTNEKYSTYKNNVIEFVNQGQNDAAIRLLKANSKPLQDEYFQSIDRISNNFEGEMKSTLGNISSDFQRQLFWGTILSLLCVVFGIGFVLRIIWNIAIRLNKVSNVMISVANGSLDLKTRLEVKSNDEIDDVARSFNKMTHSLEEQVMKEQKLSKENQDQAWIKSNLADITANLSGIQDLHSFTRTFLSKVVPLVEACQAVFYVKEWDRENNEQVFKLLASYAYKERSHISNRFRVGEGLVGQAALENSPILLANVPADYIRISSGLGEASPLNIYVLPVSFEGDVKAVIEIASFNRFSTIQQSFLEELIGNLGIILDSMLGRIRLAELLQESQVLTEELQAQSEELQTQQEELRATNEELEEQTQALRQSEEKLQGQQEELEQTNAELREKAEILEVQNKKFEVINKEVERARADLEEKARQLTLSSKYKSEFLANMSHELRTPLNSLLILSKLLSDNQDGNLSDKQIQFAKTIYSSGCDLLTLINDILDLAKIESGKMDVNLSKIRLKDVAEFVEKSFRPIAAEKNLDFSIVCREDLPSHIYSDELRLQQVLNNLLANAFKFTHQGAVKFEMGGGSKFNNRPLIFFSVTDTGIGIPAEKQELIFQAFQQADGTTSRKYGGTGLGLSICREIASLLRGEIVVESVERIGSTFTFYVGDYLELEKGEVAISIEKLESKSQPVDDEINSIESNPSPHNPSRNIIKRLLIVDDDLGQRNSLMELIGEKNVIIKAVSTGAEAIEELRVHQFDCLVLDLGLSDTTGFDLLGKIKTNPANENLKIFIYTGRDLTTKEEMYLKRHTHTIIIKDSHAPQRLMDELELYLNSSSEMDSIEDAVVGVERIHRVKDLEGKKVLLVDDDVRNVFAISNVLEMYGMLITFAENGIEGLELLKEHPEDFDLVLMDIMMPEMDGYETIKRIREIEKYAGLPIIALTAKAMKEDREKCMNAGASDYIVKPVKPDQLISLLRVWLFLKEGEK